MYAIDADEGHLWGVNKKTGATEDIGYTWEEPEANYLQSMEFDHSTNTLYWALNNIYDEGALAKSIWKPANLKNWISWK